MTDKGKDKAQQTRLTSRERVRYKRKREPLTENLAETAKEIETGNVAATETNSTH